MLHSFDIDEISNLSLRLPSGLERPSGKSPKRAQGPWHQPALCFPCRDLPRAACPFLKVRLGLCSKRGGETLQIPGMKPRVLACSFCYVCLRGKMSGKLLPLHPNEGKKTFALDHPRSLQPKPQKRSGRGPEATLFAAKEAGRGDLGQVWPTVAGKSPLP